MIQQPLPEGWSPTPIPIHIIACVPLDTTLLETLVPELAPRIKKYENSEQEACESCGDAIWVGPKQHTAREVLKLSNETFATVCILCGLIMSQKMREAGHTTEIKHLGGTHEENKDD